LKKIDSSGTKFKFDTQFITNHILTFLLPLQALAKLQSSNQQPNPTKYGSTKHYDLSLTVILQLCHKAYIALPTVRVTIILNFN
jgi:hypothetical protein